MIPNRFIYGLVDPRDGRVRYIGKTSVGLKRPKSHLKPSGDTYKDRWVRSLRRVGAIFKIRILESVEHEEDLNAAERKWITHFRGLYGRVLTNRTEGGDGGAMPPDIRAAHSRRMKDRKPPITGKKHSEESRRKMSLAAKRRWAKMSKEEISNRQKSVLEKRWANPERRAEWSERMCGEIWAKRRDSCNQT